MIEETLLEVDDKMEKAVAVAKEDFATIRTGRPTPATFNKITVEYYGSRTPLNQLASFSVPEPRMVVISPFDVSARTEIINAIRNSDLGVNPSDDGQVIRVVFPDLSEERRKEYVKVARTKAEDAKVSIRNVRRRAKDSFEKAVKAGDLGEDEAHRAQTELDEMSQKYVAAVDELLKHKESDLLEV